MSITTEVSQILSGLKFESFMKLRQSLDLVLPNYFLHQHFVQPNYQHVVKKPELEIRTNKFFKVFLQALSCLDFKEEKSDMLNCPKLHFYGQWHGLRPSNKVIYSFRKPVWDQLYK